MSALSRVASIVGMVLLLVAGGTAAAAPGDARFAYTDAFAKATMFKSDCVGIACAPTAEFGMARRAAKDDAAVVPYLLERYERAPRAGQLYIALVIRAHDRAKGEALLRQLAALKAETVQTMFGCIIAPERLDKLAGGYLSEKDFKFD